MAASTMRYNIAIVGSGAKEGKKYYEVIMFSLLGVKEYMSSIAKHIKAQQHFLE